MDEPRKEYSIVGTVTIGTDEYRDLIEAVKDAKNEADRNSTERWNEYRRANDAETELKEVKAKLEKYEAFIKQDTVKDKYALFLVSFEE